MRNVWLGPALVASLAAALAAGSVGAAGCADPGPVTSPVNASPEPGPPAGTDPEAGPQESEEELTSKRTLELVVSVDWEGRDLTEANVGAMETFRKRFPDVPMTQFLNAAYYTKPSAKAPDVTARIQRALLPRDEHGLHVHGWKRLFEASGVAFRRTPTFWGPSTPLQNDCNVDCGHEVPISAYTTDELRKVFRYSLDTLEIAGFSRARSFRAGGWMAKPVVLEALVSEGIVRDNSAVNEPFLREEIGTLPLDAWLRELWPAVTSVSQPYLLKTPAGPIMEIPDNGALADYISAQDMLGVYAVCAADKKKNPTKSVSINVGFHQETAARYLPALAEAIDGMVAQAKRDGLTLRATTTDRLPRPVR